MAGISTKYSESGVLRSNARIVSLTEDHDGTGFPRIARSVTFDDLNGNIETVSCTATRNPRGYYEHDGESCPIHEPEDVAVATRYHPVSGARLADR